jgi:hypothetical protein
MSYALVQDVAASWHDYQRLHTAALEPVPPGLILHAAGPTDEGFRIIEIWQSQAAWESFHAERLRPAVAELADPIRPRPRFRDLHAHHLVLGNANAVPPRQRGRATGESARPQRTTRTKRKEQP